MDSTELIIAKLEQLFTKLAEIAGQQGPKAWELVRQANLASSVLWIIACIPVIIACSFGFRAIVKAERVTLDNEDKVMCSFMLSFLAVPAVCLLFVNIYNLFTLDYQTLNYFLNLVKK